MEPSNNNKKIHGELPDHYLPALTGIRFFAIFHIFMFHLLSMYGSLGQSEEFKGLLSGFDDAPRFLVTLASNGWISTSLFFLLSGFILSYLYWGEDGKLTTTSRKFWFMRMARIYPIHLIVMALILMAQVPWYLGQEMPLTTLIPSAVATVALVQAWVPPWIPLWSWPAWTISVLVFLYLIMPWLMDMLGRLSRTQMIIVMIAMPFVSVTPTFIYAAWLETGADWNMNVDMFVANNPLFWVPYFTVGMLMTRIFSISRFNPPQARPSRFSWGDVAFIIVLGIAFTPGIEQPLKFFIRQGLSMPLFVVIVLDLARGRGLLARFFTLPGTGFLGETGYSMFIWQSVVMMTMAISFMVVPGIGPFQIWIAIALIMALAIPSTHLIEKPLARVIRRKYIDRDEKD